MDEMIDFLRDVVARHFGLRVRDMCGFRRHRDLVRARMVAMYLARIVLGMSYPRIGVAFGGRHHTTVMYAEHMIEAARKCDGTLDTQINKLVTLLQTRQREVRPGLRIESEVLVPWRR